MSDRAASSGQTPRLSASASPPPHPRVSYTGQRPQGMDGTHPPPAPVRRLRTLPVPAAKRSCFARKRKTSALGLSYTWLGQRPGQPLGQQVGCRKGLLLFPRQAPAAPRTDALNDQGSTYGNSEKSEKREHHTQVRAIPRMSPRPVHEAARQGPQSALSLSFQADQRENQAEKRCYLCKIVILC